MKNQVDSIYTYIHESQKGRMCNSKLKKKIPKLFQIQGTYTPAFARKHFLQPGLEDIYWV